MKILLRSRTADQFDWEQQVIHLHRLPCIGEYIKVPLENGEAQHHEIRIVVHVAGGGEVEAEVHCNKIGPRQMHKLGWTSTLAREEQTPAPSNVVMLSAKQAAAALGVSERTIRRLIESKKLAATALGTKKRPNYRIDPMDLKTLKSLDEPETRATPEIPTRRGRRPRTPSSVREYLTKY